MIKYINESKKYSELHLEELKIDVVCEHGDMIQTQWKLQGMKEGIDAYLSLISMVGCLKGQG